MQEDCKPILNTGLRGVTIASTKISDVDGSAGRLIYRGYMVKDIAQNVCFEEIVYLLLYEKMPDSRELKAFKEQMARERDLPKEILAAMALFPADALPMDVLQAVAPMLACFDPDVRDPDKDATGRMALGLTAKFATIVAAWERIRNGENPVPPNPELSHAANFLYMLKGEVPDETTARFFDTALVLHAEHSFNASTFAAREVASTRAHIYAAITAAVGSLSGALHGGANTRVMGMLKKIGDKNAVDAFVQSELDAGRRIMGLGHAVYQVDDPRALILAPMSKEMGEKSGDTRWYEISKALEVKAKSAFKKAKGRDIFVNVDFYSASLYYNMGIPMDQFTPVFAVSRISGWCAHVIEEQFAGAAPKPMLYRPESDYIGDYCGPDVCQLTPLEER